MSQYNKTVLTNAGLELAKRANAGQAKFEITRAVTSADDWSNKTIQDLEEVTAIPNIMQQGTVMDTEEVESNNSVIGVSLCFANKNLSTGYQIRIIGVYVKEEGQENDFLYAVTTAVTPEYMPDFNDKVLYRFNMQMYLVIGKAQAVNVVINDGASVTHGQLDKYKGEVADNLKKLESTHKEDMSHVAKSASINGGAEILPDSTGKLNLVVPDPDLSEYVSLEQLTEILQAKADVADVNKQIKAVTDLANTKADQTSLDATNQTVATKANSSDVNNQLTDIKNNFINTTGNEVDNQTVKCSDYLTNTTVKFNSCTVSDAPSWFASQFVWLTVHKFDDNTIIQKLTSVNFSNKGDVAVRTVNSKGDVTRDWRLFATNEDINNLKSVVDTKADKTTVENNLAAKANQSDLDQTNAEVAKKANSADVYTKTEVDSKTSGTVVTAYNIASKNPTKETNSYTNKWLVDQNVLGQFADQINQLKGRQEVDAPDFNTLTDTGVYMITNPDKGKNFPTPSRGPLVVFNGSGSRITQLYVSDDGASAFVRTYGVNNSTTWSSWNQIAWTSDITSLQNKVNVYVPLYRDLKQFNNWSDLFDDYAHSKITAKIGRLVAFRDDTNGSNTVGNYGSGIAFGGGDTSGVLSIAPFFRQARITAGNGDAYVWHEDIAWKSDVNDLQNQIQQLKDNQFEVQTFTDATAAANWEAQKPGKRMAIVNS